MTDAERASVRKYRQTAKGKAAAKRINAKRIILGGRCIGYAKTADERRAIQAHIQRRRREFVAGFKSGAETQSVSAG